MAEQKPKLYFGRLPKEEVRKSIENFKKTLAEGKKRS